MYSGHPITVLGCVSLTEEMDAPECRDKSAPASDYGVLE